MVPGPPLRRFVYLASTTAPAPAMARPGVNVRRKKFTFTPRQHRASWHETIKFCHRLSFRCGSSHSLAAVCAVCERRCLYFWVICFGPIWNACAHAELAAHVFCACAVPRLWRVQWQWEWQRTHNTRIRLQTELLPPLSTTAMVCTYLHLVP